jgi:uncharacterized protein YjbI with pentapeptide repeats
LRKIEYWHQGSVAGFKIRYREENADWASLMKLTQPDSSIVGRVPLGGFGWFIEMLQSISAKKIHACYSERQVQNGGKSVPDEEHLQIIRQGVAAWNEWRGKNPELFPNLWEANLVAANLVAANLIRADLRRAYLSNADLPNASLSDADLSRADLRNANLSDADLSRADLSGADLSGTQLIHTDLRGASMAGSRVYGASVWDIKAKDRTNQQNLVITPDWKGVITVDNIEVAQFIYLLLNNQAIRKVIDTITSKAVLILGRFSEERKPVLDAIRDELRKHNYLPIVFDFQPSTNQTTIETIKTLAGMARFIIADITDARSVLQELQAIVPGLPSVAVRLLIKKSEHEHGMLDYIRAYSQSSRKRTSTGAWKS